MADKPKRFPAGTPFSGPSAALAGIVDPVIKGKATETEVDTAYKRALTKKLLQEIDERKGLAKSPAQIDAEAYARSHGSAHGKNIAGLETALPGRQQAAQAAIDQLNTFIKHPGFGAIMGWPNPFKGGFGLFNMPNSEAADAQALWDQIKGGQFQQGAATMRGLGAMSEFEGKKAADAQAAFSKLTGENAFKRNAQVYANSMSKGIDIAKRQVRGARASLQPSREDLIAEAKRRGLTIPDGGS